VGLVGHVYLPQQLHSDFGAVLDAMDVAEVHRQHDVLDHRERGKQLEELEHDADGLTAPDRKPVLVELVDGRPTYDHLPRTGPIDSGDHVDERGLPRA
jgi:hypothetical protein